MIYVCPEFGTHGCLNTNCSLRFPHVHDVEDNSWAHTLSHNDSSGNFVKVSHKNCNHKCVCVGEDYE